MSATQPVLSYLFCDGKPSNINRTRLCAIRERYSADPLDDQSLRTIAQELSLTDDATNICYLRCCLKNDSVDAACAALCNQYEDDQIANTRPIRQSRITPSPALSDLLQTSANIVARSSETSPVESVSEAMCVILVKQRDPESIEFVQDFLLAPLTHASLSPLAAPSSASSLPRRCVLDIFIRHQFAERDVIELGRQMEKIRLVDSVHVEDGFSVWNYDHLRGILDLWLVPSQPAGKFPLKWKLAPDARLHYRLQTGAEVAGESTELARDPDRPSTVSLERFVQDVCESQNNQSANKWIHALREDDIVTYSHLSSLHFTEWAEVRGLSVNARKILKSAVDREKEMGAQRKKTPDTSQKGRLMF